MNKTKIVFGIGIVLAVLAVLTAPAVAQDPDNVFHLVPVDSSCDGAGCTTTVWVRVNTTYNDINAAQAGIIFDPSVVNVTNVVKGTPSWYMWDWEVYDYGTDMKYVFIGCSDIFGAFGPGELDLGMMTLQGETPGVSALNFMNESEVGYGVGRHTEISHPEGVICGPDAKGECTMGDGTFTCLAPQETFSKELAAGWSLISLPLTSSNNSAAKVLETVAHDAVYRYSATAPKKFESVSTMDPGAGYFVNVTASGQTWTYNGTPYKTMNISLEPGLNMVGWLNCSKSVTDALSSLDGKYNYVAMFNATSKKFEVYNPHAPSVFNDFTMMDRGTGYFISARAGCPWLNESCPP